MHINRTIQVALLLIGVVTLTVGCPGVLPGSRAYQPRPKYEAKFAAQAKYDVFPNDVRQHPDSFTNTLVAWTGVITNIQYFTNISPRLVRLTASHHYFDWVEDSGGQRARFSLSPHGEGAFAVQWIGQTEYDLTFVSQFEMGDMLIAYGYPTIIRSNYIGLYPSEYIRAVKPRWYSTNALDYGGPSEPGKDLETAE